MGKEKSVTEGVSGQPPGKNVEQAFLFTIASVNKCVQNKELNTESKWESKTSRMSKEGNISSDTAINNKAAKAN